MAKASKIAGGKPKKTLKKEVAVTLTEIFPDIKEAVGEKKFSKKVKKASKILSAGAAKKKVKKEKSSKETAKKIKLPKAAKASKKQAKPVAQKDKKKNKAVKPAAVIVPAPGQENQ